jgi:hypothetical protein
MAIGLIVTDGVGSAAAYHRITRAEYDFDRMQLHITVKSYADETYRSAEKAEIAQIEAAIARHAQLKDKEALTHEESAELAALNISELEARKYTPRHMREWKMTLDIEADIRQEFYLRVTGEIPLFQGGAEV